MNFVLDGLMDQSFERKRYTIKTTDAPWMSNHIEKRIRDRKKYYKKHGYGDGWRKKKTETDRLVANAKEKFRREEEDKLKEFGAHQLPYRAIQRLKTHDRPVQLSLIHI